MGGRVSCCIAGAVDREGLFEGERLVGARWGCREEGNGFGAEESGCALASEAAVAKAPNERAAARVEGEGGACGLTKGSGWSTGKLKRGDATDEAAVAAVAMWGGDEDGGEAVMTKIQARSEWKRGGGGCEGGGRQDSVGGGA